MYKILINYYLPFTFWTAIPNRQYFHWDKTLTFCTKI